MTSVVAGMALALSLLLVARPRSSRGRLLHVQRGSHAPSAPPHGSALLRRWRHRREVGKRRGEVVELVFALAAELRAGRPPGRALALVASSSSAMRALLTDAAVAVEAGARPGAELARLATIPGCGALGPVASAWIVTESAGGAVAEVLDRLGEVLEAEQQARDALDAALAGPRATMVLLAGLPVLGLVLGESLGADPVGLLAHRPLGWALLATGAMLDGVGVCWTRVLVRRALR